MVSVQMYLNESKDKKPKAFRILPDTSFGVLAGSGVVQIQYEEMACARGRICLVTE
jgi:hypothetical protein